MIARQTIIESIVRKAGVVGVLEEDDAIARAEDTGRVQAISIPVARYADISNIPQEEAGLRRSFAVAVSQKELSGGGTEYANRVYAIPIPVAGNRLIARVPEGEDHFGKAEVLELRRKNVPLR